MLRLVFIFVLRLGEVKICVKLLIVLLCSLCYCTNCVKMCVKLRGDVITNLRDNINI